MIQVEDYNEDWPKWFGRLHSEIWPSIQDIAMSLEHVGSTSVPGLAAKPVIDMDVIVKEIEDLVPVIEALKKLGYEHRGNLGIAGREAFRAPQGKVKHNLYACIENCIPLKNHLALRNHLRSSSAARDEYSLLKKKLAAQFPNSIDHYVEGKTQFILSIISKYGMSEAELASIEEANRAPSGR